MPDISMCLNKQCPLFAQCYRAQARANPYRQCYADFKFEIKDGKTFCKDFWPLKH